MCWFTLTPAKGKKNSSYQPSTDSSCAEDIVRVHRSPKSPRLTNVRVRMPSLDVEVDEKHTHAHVHPHLQHHHRHPHLHPLNMHPIHGEHEFGLGLTFDHNHHHHHAGHHLHNSSLSISDISEIKLRGHGRKRSISSSCPPPPPSRCPPPPSRPAPPPPPPVSSPPAAAPPSKPCEPIYHTQIIAPTAVRETTRAALRRVQTDRATRTATRNSLRRVAGYQVLGRQVPWDWDCYSERQVLHPLLVRPIKASNQANKVSINPNSI
ncbi:hypothetical protein TW65_08667 [Stemphylium lycopersici]|nr:hypothetical protein TW65_08667 [Stemphylium lycopersici]